MSGPKSTDRYTGMVDAYDRVTGALDYTANRRLDGMLHARVLRSTRPHARLRAIDVRRAMGVPGVVAILTGADLAARGDIGLTFGPVYRDQPILALGKVRFVGEPVAAVAAVDLDAAQAAIDLIDVEYEDLPAVFDVDSAQAPGAPLLHEKRPESVEGPGESKAGETQPSNVCHVARLRKGDVDRGFADADHVFEDVFTSPAAQHVPLEAHVCIADVRRSRVTLWASHQNPHGLRSQIAGILQRPLTDVRVIVPTLGGGYGSKSQITVEAIAAVLSLTARQPVRLQLTREEAFISITKHGARIHLKTGVRRDGTILARQSTCYFNTGAYANIGPRVIKQGGFVTAGPYSIPNVAIDSYAIYTNLPSAGAFRGFGASQAAWAYESQMDMIAERLGLDPYAVRQKNLLVDGTSVMTGEPMRDAHFGDLLERAARAIGWDPHEPPTRAGMTVRAKGLSCIIKGTTTPTTSTAIAKLNDDGSLDILTSSVEMGQGLLTALAILGAEPLGVDISRVRVSTVDTDSTPFDFMTASSRSTYSMGTAVQRAVGEIRTKLLLNAAELLEVSPSDLDAQEGRVVVKGVPGRSLGYAEIVRKTRSGNLIGEGTFRTEGSLHPETGQGIGSVHWHQAAGAADVEVDLETGRVRLLRYHAGVYAGRVVNPVQAELQTEGNIAFGVGQALFEELAFEGGQLKTANLSDYMIASSEDMPAEIDLMILENLPANEIHGIGESALPAVMPAIGNAVARATGVRIRDLPITPEKILAGLRALEVPTPPSA